MVFIMNMRKFFAVAAMALPLIALADYDYTFYLRPDGNDSNNGRSYANAVKTWNKLLLLINNVTTPTVDATKIAYVYPGTYPVTANIECGIGKGSRNFVIMGVKDDGVGEVFEPADKWGVIIDCQNLYSAFTSNYGNTGYNRTFQNLTFINGKNWHGMGGGNGGFLRFGGPNYYQNCVFSNGVAEASGGALSLAANDEVTDCDFYDCRAGKLGGAIFVSEADAQMTNIRNCNFYNCAAGGTNEFENVFCQGTNDVESTYGGGAIACPTGASKLNGLNIYDCTFSNCVSSSSGGAIWGCTPCVSNCTFDACVAEHSGSAMYFHCLSISNRTNSFYNCKFRNCLSCGGTEESLLGHRGGVVSAYWSSSSHKWRFEHCDFLDNVTYGTHPICGSGTSLMIYSDNVASNNVVKWTERLDPYNIPYEKNVANTALFDYSSLFDAGGSEGQTIKNNIFVNNLSYGAYNVRFGKRTTVENCVFIANTNATYSARNYTTWGGALAFKVTNGDDDDTVRNCLFAHNRSMYRGANGAVVTMTLGSKGIRFENCTVYSNATACADSYGAGISCKSIDNSSSRTGWVRNCISYGNFFLNGTRNNNVDIEWGGTNAGVSNCMFSVRGSVDNPLNNRVGIDPKFIDPDHNDFHIRASSPAKSHGMVLDWMASGTDLEGNARLNNDGTVAVGAYRFTPYAGFTMLVIR